MTLPQHKSGILFFLVAPAGAGKNALMNKVMARIEGLRQLPTATTRSIRPGEEPGREHLFLSVDQFKQMIEKNELLEWQEVHGRYYGVPRATVENAIETGQDLIADIDYKGATFIRSVFPKHVFLIFIQPPSVEVLIERMRTRGENDAEIARRLVRVPTEMAAASQCDYLIVNDELEQAAEMLHSIIVAQRSRRDADALRENFAQMADPYICAAAAVIASEAAVLTRVDSMELHTVPVQSGEQPYETVLRVLREETGLPLSIDQLPTIDGKDGKKLIPPAAFDIKQQNGSQQVTMIYVFRLPERLPAPEGWTWTRHEEAALPQPILDVLAASPT